MKLKLKNRDRIGSNKVKHIRRKGWIPGIVYGHGEESRPVKVKESDLLDLIHSLHSEATLINFELEGEEFQGLIREVVRDPLTENLLHVDFQHIHEDEEVTVNVLLDFEGEAPGVVEGGVLNIEHRELSVRCLPKDMPEEIVVDISNLEIGDLIHIGELELPEEVNIMEDPTATVVNVLSPRKVVEPTPTEEELLLGEELEEPELVAEEEEEVEGEEVPEEEESEE